MQFKLVLLIQGSVAIILLLAQNWIVTRAERQIKASAEERALVTADGVINGMNMLMETGTIGDPANRRLYIRKMAASKGINSLRIVRSKQVSDQFGPGLPEEQPSDDKERTALNTGKIYTQQIPANGALNQPAMLRVIVPFIVSHDFRGTDCLMCHHVQVGSVNGAASMMLDLSSDQKRVAQVKLRLWVGQILLQLLLTVIVWYLVRTFMRPIKTLQKTMTAMQSDGDLSRRVQILGDDEIAQMASAFNSLASNLQSSNEQRDHIEQTLRSTESRTRAVLDNLGVGVIVIDENGVIETCNPAADEIFGYAKNEAIGQNVSLLMPEPHRAQHDDYLKRYRETGKPKVLETGKPSVLGVTTEMTGMRKDGSSFPLAIKVTEVYVDVRRHLFVASVRDISLRKKNELDLRIAAIAFEAQGGMLITDLDHIIIRVNRAFTQITGYSADEAIGQTPELIECAGNGAAPPPDMWKIIARDKYWQGEICSQRKNGEVYPIWLTTTAVTDADGHVTHYVSVFSDITLRKKADEQIHRLAFYDPLTNLPNRSLLRDRLQLALAHSARHRTHGAILFIDLDNFKILNDTKGHNIGDLLLIEVARRLHDCVRSGDTVARLGGDEFVVMLEDLSEEVPSAAATAQEIGEKVLLSMSRPFTLQGFDHHSSSSIGISLFCGDGINMDELFKHADSAMYQAKTSGRNAIRFFDPALQAELVIRTALADDLRQALPRQELRLYYQVQVNAQGAIGAEALLRWQHPERGMVSPIQFIPVAEETGLIVPIGAWVLQTACSQLKAWQNDPLTRHLHLAVNVSARQFRQPDFVEQVLDVLKQTGIDPFTLKLELTESLVLENVSGSIAKMQALRAWGIRFSMDDFGTGQSSLTYLKRLPLEQIKIDQSFVRDITTDPSDATIVQTIIGMAGNLGLDVIAEGVETEQQRSFLAHNGCHAYQGYLFGKPVPIEVFEGLLKLMS
jgi:diguanylate cyclase (GGDEF)-like protein/PAS domain S-box-containing protein